MEQKPPGQPSLKMIAIGAGLGAAFGVLMGAVAQTLIGGGLPWAAIGAGMGAPIGLGITYMIVNRRPAE